MVFRNFIGDGSSSMASTPGTVYASWMAGYLGTSARNINLMHNLASGGATLSTLISRLSTVSSSLHSGWNGILCQIGANDMDQDVLSANFGTVSGWNTSVITNYLIPLSAIIRPIFCTTLQPKRNVDPGSGITYNSNRNLANPFIRNWLTLGYIDGIVDLAADPVMGPDAAAFDDALYDSTSHPTPHGIDLDIALITAALDPFIPGDVLGRFSKIKFN